MRRSIILFSALFFCLSSSVVMADESTSRFAVDEALSASSDLLGDDLSDLLDYAECCVGSGGEYRKLLGLDSCSWKGHPTKTRRQEEAFEECLEHIK